MFLGITPSNEIRDPPKYIRSVFSEPISDETFYTEYNKEFGPDESETRCFQIWERTKRKISVAPRALKGRPSLSSPAGSGPSKPRQSGEKQPNFISDVRGQRGGQGGGTGCPPTTPPTTPPLSPGRVRVSRQSSLPL